MLVRVIMFSSRGPILHAITFQQPHWITWRKPYYPRQLFWLTVNFLKSVFFPSPDFFDGQYPMFATSNVNYVVTDIILWRELTETK